MNRLIDRGLSFLDRLTRWRYLYLALFLLALATRIIGAVLGGTGGDRGDDDGMQLGMALNFLAGKGISMEWQGLGTNYAFQPPGLTVLHIIFISLFHNYWLMERVFFVIMSSICFVLFYPLAKRYFSPTTALVGTLILLLYPVHWFWSTRINSHTYATNMLIVVLLLTLVAWEKRSAGLGFLAGLIWATMGQMRPEYTLGPLCVALASWFALKDHPRFQRLFVVSFLAGWIAMLMPWTIRNYLKVGRPIPSSMHYSYNFWLVFNPQYDYNGQTYTGPPELVARLKSAGSETARADIWMQEGMRFIRENPRIAVDRVVGNFLNYWRPWLSFKAVPLHENLLYIATYLPLFLLFMVGLFQIPYRDPRWMMVCLFFVYKIVAQLPFYMIVRFREATIPIILLIALLPVHRWLQAKNRPPRLPS